MQGDVANSRQADVDQVTIPRGQLEQLQRIASIGAVSSSVAHEFNNILTTILNHAKLGLRCADMESAQKSFEKILSSARRASKITTGVLALSHNRTARAQSTDIVEMVEEVLAIIEKDLMKHHVRLERDYQSAPIIDCVAAQLEQVLMNLIINARQAMPKGGTVKVGVAYQHATDMVEISVKDTGCGIEPDKLAKIFEPFYSTKDGPDQEGQGGSGLGLAICREIVERHEGRIRVESMLGKGTTFTIKLPAVGLRQNKAA
ncbi:MAG: ATP-binding protein [Planctomycetota bacterium]